MEAIVLFVRIVKKYI